MALALTAFDLVVIGSGPAGEKAAVKGAYHGKRVQGTYTATINRAVRQVPGTRLLIHEPTPLHRKSNPNQRLQLSRHIHRGHFRRQLHQPTSQSWYVPSRAS